MWHHTAGAIYRSVCHGCGYCWELCHSMRWVKHPYFYSQVVFWSCCNAANKPHSCTALSFKLSSTPRVLREDHTHEYHLTLFFLPPCRTPAQTTGSTWTSACGTSSVISPPSASSRWWSSPRECLVSPVWPSQTRSLCSKQPAWTSWYVYATFVSRQSFDCTHTPFYYTQKQRLHCHRFIVTWQTFKSSSSLFFFHPDSEDLHSLHSRPGHHDLFWWVDPDSYSDPQRRIWANDGPGFYICRPTTAAWDGRHRERPPQRHLSRLWRYYVEILKLKCHFHYCIYKRANYSSNALIELWKMESATVKRCGCLNRPPRPGGAV